MAADSFDAFLFTDIVGSTRRWAEDPEAMAVDLARHDRLMTETIAASDGIVFSKAGDSFAAAFSSPMEAVAAAVSAQRSLAQQAWAGSPLAVRMGVHSGTVVRRDHDFFGPPLNECARIMAAAHGGQILVSGLVASAVAGHWELLDLGEHRLRDLDGMWRLHQVQVPGSSNEHPPLRSLDAVRTTLPMQRTTLIGLEQTVADARRLLHAHPIVTLAGPGGVGKTRAAVEAAGQELHHHPDGVFFVDLTAARSDDDVPGAFVTGLGMPTPAGRTPVQHLFDCVAGGQVLLVVDNCEHVLDGAAEMVDALLEAGSGVRVLTTSREALDLNGEWVVPVPPLSTDHTGSAAVRLFTERALAADSSFSIGDESLETVLEIVRHLDGIPLAIELAAMRTRTLTLEQILGQLSDRSQLLAGHRRGGSSRQATLRATIDWSYNLLDSEERRAFRALSVLAGVFTFATAQGLLGVDVVPATEALDSLLSKSLLTTVDFGSGARGYRMLETIREYGRQQLDEAGETEAACLRLEQTLLPEEVQHSDPNTVLTEYIQLERDSEIEVSTRLAAGMTALDSGRLDSAALILSTAISRTEPSTHVTVLASANRLLDRASELSSIGWFAACYAKLLTEAILGNALASVEAATAAITQLEPDDPRNAYLRAWRCMVTSLFDPLGTAREVEEALPQALEHAHRPYDAAVSRLFAAKAAALLTPSCRAAGRQAAKQALEWSKPRTAARDQAVALVLWLDYLDGRDTDTHLRPLVDEDRDRPLGWGVDVAIADIVATHAPPTVRRDALVKLGRRQPLAAQFVDPSAFLVAFGHVAIDAGDHERAARLAASARLADPVTALVLLLLHARLWGWTDQDWHGNQADLVFRLLSPEQARRAPERAAVLAQELEPVPAAH